VPEADAVRDPAGEVLRAALAVCDGAVEAERTGDAVPGLGDPVATELATDESDGGADAVAVALPFDEGVAHKEADAAADREAGLALCRADADTAGALPVMAPVREAVTSAEPVAEDDASAGEPVAGAEPVVVACSVAVPNGEAEPGADTVGVALAGLLALASTVFAPVGVADSVPGSD